MTTSIPLLTARRLALHAQLLDGRSALPAGKQGALEAIEHLGYLQIDPISVIERAQHHVLWTRCPTYEPAMLHELQAVDRRVFEYWPHALSYVPMSHYRYYLPRMRARADPYHKWEADRMKKYGPLLAPVLERIRAEGPRKASEIALPAALTEGLTGRDPVKSALELLLAGGQVMVRERVPLERVYDLTERVLPPDVDTRVPDDDELGRFLVRLALSAHGVARERDIRAHIPADKETIAQALAALVDAGEVATLSIEGLGRTRFYALSEALAAAERLEPAAPTVHLLSPFDNLIALRDRVKRLLGFDYALECYKAPAKRVYGYYVLPILWGESFAGRLDPKADRKEKVLLIRNLVFEEDFTAFDDLLPALGAKLGELAQRNGCERVHLERVSPQEVRGPLEHCVAQAVPHQ